MTKTTHRTVSKPKAVEIEWVDTVAGPGWRSPEEQSDWQERTGRMQLSIGYLVGDCSGSDDIESNYVVISQSLQIGGGDRRGELLQIPRQCIRKMHRIARPAATGG